MHLIIASRADKASMSMASYILEHVDFTIDPDNDGVYQYRDYVMNIIDERHLYFDNVPPEDNGVKEDTEEITFLSSHSSSAEVKSLTVHPTGNFSGAILGGREKALSVSAPPKMTPALRRLSEAYSGNGFEITLESTHHGPYSEVPNYYIEIGTTEKEWSDPEALEAVKQAVFTEPDNVSSSFVGIGGGHYMPKVTKYVMENGVNVGHLISKHDQDTITRGQIEEALNKTPSCSGFIMDRKGCRGPVRALIAEISDEKGMEIIRL